MSDTTASVATSASNTSAALLIGSAREYLSFKLGAEEYGIDILRVQEIRGYEPPTRIANSPHFMMSRSEMGLMDVQIHQERVTARSRRPQPAPRT